MSWANPELWFCSFSGCVPRSVPSERTGCASVPRVHHHRALDCEERTVHTKDVVLYSVREQYTRAVHEFSAASLLLANSLDLDVVAQRRIRGQPT